MEFTPENLSLVLSTSGLGLQLVQWWRGLKDSGQLPCYDSFEAWLARHDEAALAIAQKNRELLRTLIDEVKDSIFSAVLTHEAGHDRRHAELLRALRETDSPTLTFMARRPQVAVRSPGQGYFTLSLLVQATNPTRSVATVNDIRAKIEADGGHYNFRLVATRRGARIEGSFHTSQFNLETGKLALDSFPGEDLSRFKLIEFRYVLIHDRKSRDVPVDQIEEFAR